MRLTAVFGVVMTAVLVGLATGVRAARTPPFTIVDLGTLGGTYGYPYDINESGQIVGVSTITTGQSHAFSWTQATGMVDLGTLGGAGSRAYDVNADGQVVGTSDTSATGPSHAFSWTQAGGMVDLSSGPYDWAWYAFNNDAGQVVGQANSRAFLWTPTGGMVYLPTLGGAYGGAAWGINNSGKVVGDSLTAAGQWHAFAWTQAGGIVDLGTLGGSDSRANYVTNSGLASGWSLTASGDRHAALWTSAGAIVDLGTLGGSFGMALDVVDSGQAVGYSTNAGGNTRAFLWTEASGMVDLGTLGGPSSSASDITASGQVVGSAYTDAGQLHAFSWTQAGGMVDLGTLGGSRSGAFRANSQGQIAGWSLTATGEQHVVLWEPVRDTTPPEINVPDDMTVNATGPAGATVEFTVTATDENPTNPAVTCVPFSGSVFGIGVTTVTCHATDNAGNIGTASFTVTVRGAPEQLATLLDDVRGVGPGTSLADKVNAAQAAYTAGDTPRTCEILNAFINQVKAQSGKSITDPDAADTLIANATRIRAVLGC